MKNILIVDDDITLLKMLAKKLETVKNQFHPIFVKDGASAISQIKNKDISLIISDLQMPKMDGYGLLEYINKNYPDIPIIIMTAFGKPKSKLILMEKGAASYFEKPVDLEGLVLELHRLIEKQSDGGILKSASLEMFTQLVEMEQKTCTIRVVQEQNNKKGVLFFREGQIYFARMGDVKGVEAAYSIFSWQNVSLFIENDCNVAEKRIQSDLQAILLEAMRLKDEKAYEISISEPIVNKIEADTDKEPEQTKLSSVEYLKRFINSNSSEFTGIHDITKDLSWREFMKRSSAIGEFLHGGELKACYIKKTDSDDMIVVGDDDCTIISIGPKCDREKIYRILMN